MACFGLPAWRSGWRGIPARVDEIVLRIRRADGRSEAEKRRRLYAARFCGSAKLGIAAQRFRPHVGGKKLRMPLFKTEIGGARVAVKGIAVAQDGVADGEQRVFRSSDILFDCGIRHEAARACKIFQPVEAPFHGTHDAVCVARGERGLPCEHPARVELAKHYHYRNR